MRLPAAGVCSTVCYPLGRGCPNVRSTAANHDAAYLAALKPAAEVADARAIEARLAKLAASAAP
jgi:hypothetical protein